jgi:hypothetical protein
MTEEGNESREKPRYEAPELLSLGETVRGIAMCLDGATPSGGSDYCTEGHHADIDCTYGYDAVESCADGEYAWHVCEFGELG